MVPPTCSSATAIRRRSKTVFRQWQVGITPCADTGLALKCSMEVGHFRRLFHQHNDASGATATPVVTASPPLCSDSDRWLDDRYEGAKLPFPDASFYVGSGADRPVLGNATRQADKLMKDARPAVQLALAVPARVTRAFLRDPVDVWCCMPIRRTASRIGRSV